VTRRDDYHRDQQLVEVPEAYLEFHYPPGPTRTTAEQIAAATVDVLGADRAIFSSRRRSPLHVLARHAACFTAERIGVSGAAIAASVGLSEQGVSYVLKGSPDVETARLVEMILARVEDAARSCSVGASELIVFPTVPRRTAGSRSAVAG